MQVFSNVRPTIPTIPRYFEISVPYHTGSIRYFQMSYLRYQRYHGILRFRYLPYRLSQVFSDVIPAIPAIPRYFGIYHTSSIRYFQMRYPRYPRVPWYGIPRVFTGVTPVNTQHDALPTEDKRPEVIRAGDVQLSKCTKLSADFLPR